MPSSKQKNLTGPYACIQALYWMYFAAIMSFSGFFLLDGGFSNTQIGIIAAAAGIISALLQPVLASYADRPDSPSLKKRIQIFRWYSKYRAVKHRIDIIWSTLKCLYFFPLSF